MPYWTGSDFLENVIYSAHIQDEFHKVLVQIPLTNELVLYEIVLFSSEATL